MEHAQSDFKWFGEGFEGFPRQLPEDCVQYTLYILDAKLSENDLLAKLKDVMNAAQKLTDGLLSGFIWHRDEFVLEIGQTDDGEIGVIQTLKFLTGCTNYGDSVEDEWLIVYLLRELSQLYPELWIEVIDTVGQFLLVEAANALPRWLNPEVADHRVWIHEGKLLVIPLAPKSTSPDSKPLTLQEAHEFIANPSTEYIHSPLIEAEAFWRLGSYPALIAESQHHALITIPRRVAYVLRSKPELVSPAVESFYLRDSIAMRPLQIRHPNGEGRVLLFPPEDFVTVSVKFTKVGFAQLRGQQFATPAAWAGFLPTASGAKELNAVETGMKVSCGFEMLTGDPQNKGKKSVVEIRRLLMALDSTNEKLPTDEEISKWEKIDDDESWLDVNFEDLDDQLSGKNIRRGAKTENSPDGGGFKGSKVYGNLQKMVERFEAFLNDDKAGADGADVDDMDMDNDDGDGDDDDDSDDDEDKDVSFDENEFARMMREMMGMPPAGDDRVDPSEPDTKVEGSSKTEDPELDQKDESEEEALRQVMQRMELELNESGVLDLDPTPQKIAATRKMRSSNQKEAVNTATTQKGGDGRSDESDGGEEVDIDINLAKNLLESFKSQAGTAGPSGNLLGMLGLQLPRDEGDGGS
ncbi:hypothetical protein GP486_002540 [Trichoglossum hirsutum]|uniref:SGT1-domain-containing protein n=1 Tax=Trichoglossum hirsutum TaxID=265104 RepID=A0A9P8RRM2_9PEZI|nr:hypothetical protein GP486_002540 [Trichoglossum hirsutum]